MKDIIYDLLFKLAKSILYFVDFIVELFYKLSGIEDVEGHEKQDFLASIISNNKVTNTFLIIGLISVLVLGIICVLAIIKAQLKRNKTNSEVLSKGIAGFISIWLLPFVLISLILLINIVFRSIHYAMKTNLGVDMTVKIGAEIFMIASKDAYVGNIASQSAVEAHFISGQLSYTDINVMKTYFNISEINYLVAIIGGGIVLFLFSVSLINLIQRIYEIVFLYMISPLAASSFPIDDGKRLSAWKDMSIAKIAGAYSIVISMNVFLMVLPLATSIKYTESAIKNALANLLIIIAGAYSVIKASSLISSLISSSTHTSLSGILSEIRLATHSMSTVTRTSKNVSHNVSERYRTIQDKRIRSAKAQDNKVLESLENKQ